MLAASLCTYGQNHSFPACQVVVLVFMWQFYFRNKWLGDTRYMCHMHMSVFSWFYQCLQKFDSLLHLSLDSIYELEEHIAVFPPVVQDCPSISMMS